jgi:hypothetical protein
VIPSEDQIRSDAQFLGFTDRDIERLVTHARRARTGSTAIDGYKSTHGAPGSRGSSESTAVERAVLTDGDGYDDKGRPEPASASFRSSQQDEVERQHELLFDMFTQAAASKRAVRNTLERLAGLQTYQKPQGHTSTECCEPGCNEPVHKAGRCTADYWRKRRFEQANPGETCPPLTADELEKRNPPRRQRVS